MRRPLACPTLSLARPSAPFQPTLGSPGLQPLLEFRRRHVDSLGEILAYLCLVHRAAHAGCGAAGEYRQKPSRRRPCRPGCAASDTAAAPSGSAWRPRPQSPTTMASTSRAVISSSKSTDSIAVIWSGALWTVSTWPTAVTAFFCDDHVVQGLRPARGRPLRRSAGPWIHRRAAGGQAEDHADHDRGRAVVEGVAGQLRQRGRPRRQ